jgi:SAM-dependent methyltransferase
MDPKEIVRKGYDQVSYAYRSDTFDFEKSGYKVFLSWLEPFLKDHAAVLDLGCGNGVPVAQVLARRFQVTGVDFSPVQISRANNLVPQAKFIQADMTQVDFPPESFDAVVAFYSIIHIPLAEQPALFHKIAHWLRPEGWFLGSVGHSAWTGTQNDWRGVKDAAMYWSHAEAATYRAWLKNAGMFIQQEGFLPEGDGGHTILLASKPTNTAP